MTLRKPVLLALFALLAVLGVGATQTTPHYQMEIRRTPTGIELKCQEGCDWIQLKGNCDEATHPECRYIIDERGIKVLPQ